MIRYLKITLVDGTRFILRVTKESSGFVHGYEVNAEGDEIVPPGYQNRHRTVDRALIAKSVEMRMNNKYATLEAVPAGERTKKTPAQLDAEIAEAIASRSAPKRHAAKRDPKIVMIEGEPWRVERKRFWLPDTGGGTMDRAWNFVRVSDGRTMTSDDKERGLRIIAGRIRDGTYAGPPMYREK